MELKDRVAIVTGGHKGIGKALSVKLAQHGAHVAMVGRDAAALDEAASEIKKLGVQALAVQGDLCENDVIDRFVRQVIEKFGRLDILINNAGVGYFAPLSELSIAHWDAMFNLNIRAVFLVTQKALPYLRQAGEAFVVNIASLAGKNAFVGGSGYAATKHALIGFSRCLMLEERKNGINVLTVCPGSVRTDFFQHHQSAETVLAKEILEPQDVAQAVVESLKLPARAMVSELDIRPANP
ncbi:SDR family oxidoreductase [Calditrichota bacterium GD2]